MKKRLYSKKIISVILIALTIMTGCSESDEKVNEQKTENKATNITTSLTELNTTVDIKIDTEESTKINAELNTSDTTYIDITHETSKYMTTEGFYHLSEAREPYIFETDTDVEEGHFHVDRIFRGEYPLLSDVKETIVVDFDHDNYVGYIDVSGIRKEFYASAIVDVAIIDVDKNDVYKEIAIYAKGPSNAESIMLFRVCDGAIYELGEYYGLCDYDNILFDKNGKIIEIYGYVDFLDTKIVTEYYQIKGNEVYNLLVNVDKAMNKEYKIAKDVIVEFTETENTNISESDKGISSRFVLKEGQKIVLIIAIPSSHLYYVELPDGRRGYMRSNLEN